MPAASWIWFHHFGPAMASATIQGSGSVTAQARGYVRAGATLNGTSDITYARPVKLISAYANLLGVGSVTTAQARGLLRCLARIKVNELSQDDVTGAVLDIPIDGEYTVREVLRIIAAAAAGKTSNSGKTFRNLSDDKDVIVGTITGSDRTAATYDPS